MVKGTVLFGVCGWGLSFPVNLKLGHGVYNPSLVTESPSPSEIIAKKLYFSQRKLRHYGYWKVKITPHQI